MMRQVSICSTSLSSKATSPGVLSTIKLGRPVCQVPLATIEVENPLTQTACLTTECKYRGIIVQLQPSVPGQSKVDNEYICHHIKKKLCDSYGHNVCVSFLYRFLWLFITCLCIQVNLLPVWLCSAMSWATSTQSSAPTTRAICRLQYFAGQQPLCHCNV